jgi:hypothetical protein
MSDRRTSWAVAFAVGAVFAAGLVVSGMSAPENVLAFLDVAGGAWSPTLSFVMGPAIGVAALCFRLARSRERPVLQGEFAPPEKSGVDAPLLLGAVLFGAGWGLSGVCPGPAVVGAVTLQPKFLIFGVGLLVGMAIFSLLRRRSVR